MSRTTPKVMTKTVSIPMTPELKTRIERAAQADSRTTADWIRMTLAAALIACETRGQS